MVKILRRKLKMKTNDVLIILGVIVIAMMFFKKDE